MDDTKVVELESEIKRLQNLVYFDELTGLHNRRGFLEAAQVIFKAVSYGRTELERRVNFNIPFSVVFLDIDNFKSINDTHGHDVGDTVLKKVSESLKKYQRSSDVYGRLGGEEFVFALIGAEVDAAKAVAEKLRKEIENIELEVDGKKLDITVSLGVITYTDEKSLEELIKKADKAMYEAKTTGRNKTVVHTL